MIAPVMEGGLMPDAVIAGGKEKEKKTRIPKNADLVNGLRYVKKEDADLRPCINRWDNEDGTTFFTFYDQEKKEVEPIHKLYEFSRLSDAVGTCLQKEQARRLQAQIDKKIESTKLEGIEIDYYVFDARTCLFWCYSIKSGICIRVYCYARKHWKAEETKLVSISGGNVGNFGLSANWSKNCGKVKSGVRTTFYNQKVEDQILETRSIMARFGNPNAHTMPDSEVLEMARLIGGRGNSNNRLSLAVDNTKQEIKSDMDHEMELDDLIDNVMEK